MMQIFVQLLRNQIAIMAALAPKPGVGGVPVIHSELARLVTETMELIATVEKEWPDLRTGPATKFTSDR